MTDTAYIVRNQLVAGILNRDLPEGSRAYSIYSGPHGCRYDRVVLLGEFGPEAAESLGDFRCYLKPGGEWVD